MGAHSAITEPRTTSTTNSIVAFTATMGMAGLAGVVGAPSAQADTNWDPIIACESGGKNINNVTYPVSSASGYFQIIDGTWRRFGGREFSSRAIGASKAEQLTVANRIAAANPSLSDWDASRPCWKGKTSAAPPPRTRTRTHGPRDSLATESRTRSVHTVARGDTLSKIAAAHHVKGGWQALYNLNRHIVGDPHRIYTGQKIRLV